MRNGMGSKFLGPVLLFSRMVAFSVRTSAATTSLLTQEADSPMSRAGDDIDAPPSKWERIGARS
jgi:hypothetical protein